MFEQLDAHGIFKYFQEISEIPRGSGHTGPISRFLVETAEKKGFPVYQDQVGNVLIQKPGSKGCEHLSPVTIQGHMDKVCEKNGDTVHDFENEGLALAIDGDFIYAEGTTLGGDDGIALAYGLALLDEENLVHPPLQLLFTVDEETGMDGAWAFDGSLLKGNAFLNLDSEEEGIFITSCAGGLTGILHMPVDYQECFENQLVSFRISGLQGGHSGTEINKNLTNANQLMGRCLAFLQENNSFSIVKLEGGLKENAIPREASAILSVPNLELFLSEADRLKQELQDELKGFEPGLRITVQKIEKDSNATQKMLTQKSAMDVVDLLQFLPNGVRSMSSHVDGLVETSLNIGILRLDEKELTVTCSVRSSLEQAKMNVSRILKRLAHRFEGTYEIRGNYPGWPYRENSRLRDICIQTYQVQYGKEPVLEALHAGLECGILLGKKPELDIVSMGPDIFDIHTPKERMSISSVNRVYDFICMVLEKLTY